MSATDNFARNYIGKQIMNFDFGTQTKMCLKNMHDKNIYFYNNLLLELKFAHKISPENAFDCISNISLQIGNLTMFDLPGKVIHEILRMSNKYYEEFTAANELIIPIQDLFLSNEKYLPAVHDVIICYDISSQSHECIITNGCIYVTRIDLDEDTNIKSTPVMRYHIEKLIVDGLSKISIDFLIKNIIVLSSDNSKTWDRSSQFNLPVKGSERAVPALVGQGNTGIEASSITCLRRDSSAALGGQGKPDVKIKSQKKKNPNYFPNNYCRILENFDRTIFHRPDGNLITFDFDKEFYLRIKTSHASLMTIVYCYYDILEIDGNIIKYASNKITILQTI